MHRLRLRLRTCDVVCRDRARGVDTRLTATALMERQVLTTTKAVDTADFWSTLTDLFQCKYINAVAEPTATSLWVVNITLSVFFAVLPGITRAAKLGKLDDDHEICTEFLGRSHHHYDQLLSPIEHFIALDAMILTSIGTRLHRFIHETFWH